MRIGAVSAVVAVVGLSLPARTNLPAPPGEVTPFRWDAADLFDALEREFEAARGTSLEVAEGVADSLDVAVEAYLERIATSTSGMPAEAMAGLAELQFRYAILGAAHPALLSRVEAMVTRARVAVMRAAASWPPDRPTHEALYRLVFGGRIAMEEALVQAGPEAASALVEVEAIASATPYIDVQGVRVHSGDLLLSRGGAPTSALIARGSDFANTFSHVALAHVDEETGVGTVVESLIETGTVLTTVEEYLESKKHRILVLRLRPDLPELEADPLLPHRAATRMLERLRDDHAEYDFAMDWQDPTRMFCSEVVYHAYDPLGVDLWSNRSAMTSPGLVRWLGAMGVSEFRTLVPSDLEYDARLRAVVEWRDLEALTDYRLDNAITDVLLERADAGSDLGYPWYLLPVGRALKGVSLVQAGMGRRPLVPTGMSVDAALRVRALVTDVNPSLKAALIQSAAGFEEERGFPPPYWTLVDLAREALDTEIVALGPSLR